MAQRTNQNWTEYDMVDATLKQMVSPIASDGRDFRQYRFGKWPEVHEFEIQNQIVATIKDLSNKGTLPGRPGWQLERNVLNCLRREVFVEQKRWDNQENILVLRNRALDTEAGETIPHSPEHYATVGLDYDYDPSATAPAWHQVLETLLSEDERNFFQEFAGYTLTHSTRHQMALWLSGAPGGGKSTLIAGLEAMLGPMTSALGLNQLSGDFGLQHVIGKTLLTSTETPTNRHIKTADIINALITGDTVLVNRKNRDPIEYRNTSKLLWAMNSKPGLYDAGNGLFRRIKVLEIGAIPPEKRDESMIERVKLEREGILTWALTGLHRLNERGHFDYPASVQAATKSYQAENDLPGQFLEERTERAEPQLFYTSDYTVYGSELIQAFNTWATENGFQPWNGNKLAESWERLKLEPGSRDKHGKKWYGVRLV